MLDINSKQIHFQCSGKLITDSEELKDSLLSTGHEIGAARFKAKDHHQHDFGSGQWCCVFKIEGNYLDVGGKKYHFSNFDHIVDYKQNEKSQLYKFKDGGEIHKKYLSGIRSRARKEERERLETIESEKRYLAKKEKERQTASDFIYEKQEQKKSLTIKDRIKKLFKI